VNRIAAAKAYARRYWDDHIRGSFSVVGLLVGALFFSASLTPSLVPRAAELQGLLSGVSIGAGYGVGALSVWLWRYLELPELRGRSASIAGLLAAATCALIAAASIRQASAWQNSIRDLMSLEPLDGARVLLAGTIATLVFLLLIGLARLFQIVFRIAARSMKALIPRRLSNLLAVVVAAALFASVINGVVFRQALHFADSSYETLDALMDVDIAQPAAELKTGSPSSSIDWGSIGRRGREFIGSGPTRQDLEAFLNEPALDPLRVYVGLRSADTVEDRAKMALLELQRVGAFDRSVLVVATPTGTGWVDPEAIDPLEYLLAGDVATVAMQYSYLASWLSLLVEPGYGSEASRALFSEVYDYWTSLPSDRRPRLYLFGLSLGALSSEQAARPHELFADPPQGALWAGPPFASTTWRSVTDDREPGSPFWLPRFGNGSVVRFTSQQNALAIPGARWGPMRIVYLQYASDPVTFFEPSLFYRRPAWLSGPRGPDVSPQLRWYPIITALQIGIDNMVATNVPAGFGHRYAAEHYIDAWIAITEPRSWDSAKVEALKDFFAQARRNRASAD